MKFFSNCERWLDHAFGWVILQKGWRLSGQWPWNLRSFLERFSGFQFLTEEDFAVISSVFGQLVLIPHATGTLHESSVRSFLCDWIKNVQVKSLSLEARYLLASDEIAKGPIEDKNIQNFGTVILTHRVMKEKMKEDSRRVIHQKVTAERERLARAAESERKESESLSMYQTLIEAAKVDIARDGFDESTAQWRQFSVNHLKATYKHLFSKIQRPSKQPTLKGDLIRIITSPLRRKLTIS